MEKEFKKQKTLRVYAVQIPVPANRFDREVVALPWYRCVRADDVSAQSVQILHLWLVTNVGALLRIRGCSAACKLQ